MIACGPTNQPTAISSTGMFFCLLFVINISIVKGKMGKDENEDEDDGSEH